MLNNPENKGEFDDLSQLARAENCAIGDAVAQLKMKWRKSRGAIEDIFNNPATKEPSEEVPASFLRCLVVKIPLVSFWADCNTELYDKTIFLARPAFADCGH